MKQRNLYFFAMALFFSIQLQAQNDVMMQAFYWNVPVNEAGKNGFWYDSLNAKIPAMKTAGIRALWMPPPSKGNWGISDMATEFLTIMILALTIKKEVLKQDLAPKPNY